MARRAIRSAGRGHLSNTARSASKPYLELTRPIAVLELDQLLLNNLQLDR